MKRSTVALLLCTFALSGCPQQAPQKPVGTGLDAPWDTVVGDAVAERAVGRLRLKGVLNAPMSARYDRKSKVVVIDVGGAREKVEECKETIDKIRSVLLTEVKPLVSSELGVAIDEEDFLVVYTNRDTGREIVRMEKGKWLLAGP